MSNFSTQCVARRKTTTGTMELDIFCGSIHEDWPIALFLDQLCQRPKLQLLPTMKVVAVEVA